MSRFVQHPFGRENEVSVRRLLYSFCNNLYLGQWELAEACTNELHEQRDLDKGDITSLLEDIVSYPYERSIGAANKSIQSPHHLSWMCLEALKKLIGKVSEEKREEVEFRLILFEADLPKQIAKEYHVFYTRTVQKETPPNLSEVSLEALGNFMLDNPMVAHTMIQKLTAVCTDKEQKMFLYEVYITTIQKILSKLHTRKSGQASEDGTDLGSEKVSIDVVFHVLSLFSAPECYIEELRDRFSELFHFIINVVLNSGGEFGLEHIYSALLGRDSDSLLQIFLASFRDYKRKSIAFHRQLDFNATELEACVLSLSDKGDRKKLWEELYLSALPQNQHALDVVMGLGIKLVKSSQFTQLKKLLAVEDFSCLKPLLMLIGWDHCRSITQGYELVESLQDLCTENILLHKSCHRLKRKATQLKQFLHMIKEYLPDDSADIEALLKHHHFSGLSQYSPLYMLNNSCTLSQMPEEGVMALLKSEASGLSHGSLVEVSIYQGFCAIKSFLAALINSASMRSWVARSADSSGIYSRETPTDPIDRDSPAHLGMNRTSSCSHSPVSTLDLEDLQIKYPEKVLEHLEHVKSILSELQPLHYRVEILENLFSLLFVRLDCIDDEGETNEELPGNECDNQDQPSSPPLDDTPVPGTPVTPTTPVYLTPSKVLDSHLGSHLGSMGGRLEKVTRNLNQDFFPKFMANLSSIQEKQTANKQGKFERVLNDQEDGLHDMDDTSDGHNSDKEGVKTKKDQQQTHKVKEMTDNSSAASKGSSLGLGHLGFIANEYFVRDALFMLKACVEQVSSSLSEAEDTAGYDRLQCSLTRSSVKQHSIRLTQYISEGLWRLQLISHRAVPFEYGKILADISRLDYDSSEEEPNWTDDEQTSSSTAKKRKRKHTSDSQSGTEGHMTNEGSQSNNTSISRKSPRQRHSHHPRRQRSKRGARGLMESGLGGVIPRMLADRNSLLVMCLRRGKFSQASQVVKLFGLEQTVEDAEVLFADHFQAAVEKVHSHDSKLAKHLAHEQEMSRHKSPLSGTRLSLTSQSLIGNIASKAAKGASTMTVSNTAEQLLGLTIQPALHHRSGDVYSLLKPPLNQHINPDLIPAMIVLDLACSSSTTWESSGVLLDVAMRRLPSHLKQGKMAASGSHERDLMEPPSVLHTQSSKKDTKPLCALKGIMGVLERLSTLVQSCSSKPEVMGNVTSHCSGINTCLNTGVAPLDAESCTILYLALKELESALQKTQVALKSVTLLSDGRERSRGHHGRTGREQDAKRPSLRTAFKNLVTQCSKATVKNGLMQYIVR